MKNIVIAFVLLLICEIDVAVGLGGALGGVVDGVAPGEGGALGVGDLTDGVVEKDIVDGVLVDGVADGVVDKVVVDGVVHGVADEVVDGVDVDGVVVDGVLDEVVDAAIVDGVGDTVVRGFVDEDLVDESVHGVVHGVVDGEERREGIAPDNDEQRGHPESHKPEGLITLFDPSNYDPGNLASVAEVAKANANLDGKTLQQNDPSLAGVSLDGKETKVDSDNLEQECENGKCKAVHYGNPLDIGVGINKKTVFEYTIPNHKYRIFRKYQKTSYTANNVFGKGVPKLEKKNHGDTCKNYSKCKKFHISPIYGQIDSPYLYGTPFYTKKHDKGVTKQIISQNFYAPGKVPATYAVENNNQYLVTFKENLKQYSSLYDNSGSCDAEKLSDQAAV